MSDEEEVDYQHQRGADDRESEYSEERRSADDRFHKHDRRYDEERHRFSDAYDDEDDDYYSEGHGYKEEGARTPAPTPAHVDEPTGVWGAVVRWFQYDTPPDYDSESLHTIDEDGPVGKGEYEAPQEAASAHEEIPRTVHSEAAHSELESPDYATQCIVDPTVMGNMYEGQTVTVSFKRAPAPDKGAPSIEIRWLRGPTKVPKELIPIFGENRLQHLCSKDDLGQWLAVELTPVFEQGHALRAPPMIILLEEQVQPAKPQIRDLKLNNCFCGANMWVDYTYFGGFEGETKVKWEWTRDGIEPYPSGNVLQPYGITGKEQRMVVGSISHLHRHIKVTVTPVRKEGHGFKAESGEPVSLIQQCVIHRSVRQQLQNTLLLGTASFDVFDRKKVPFRITMNHKYVFVVPQGKEKELKREKWNRQMYIVDAGNTGFKINFGVGDEGIFDFIVTNESGRRKEHPFQSVVALRNTIVLTFSLFHAMSLHELWDQYSRKTFDDWRSGKFLSATLKRLADEKKNRDMGIDMPPALNESGCHRRLRALFKQHIPEQFRFVAWDGEIPLAKSVARKLTDPAPGQGPGWASARDAIVAMYQPGDMEKPEKEADPLNAGAGLPAKEAAAADIYPQPRFLTEPALSEAPMPPVMIRTSIVERAQDLWFDEKESPTGYRCVTEKQSAALQQVITELTKDLRNASDLASAGIPVVFYEKRSLLEALGDFLIHASLLEEVVKSKKPADRILALTKWYLASWHHGPQAIRKPITPVVGEVFWCRYIAPPDQNQSKYLEYFAEQVGPNTTAVFVRNTDRTVFLQGSFETEARWKDNCAVCATDGQVHLDIEGKGYDCTWPFFFCQLDQSTQEMRFEIVGKAFVKTHASNRENLKAEIEFHEQSVFQREPHRVSAVVKQARNTLATIDGRWNGVITKQDTQGRDNKQPEVWFDCSAEGCKKLGPILHRKLPKTRNRMYSRNVWSRLKIGPNSDPASLSAVERDIRSRVFQTPLYFQENVEEKTWRIRDKEFDIDDLFSANTPARAGGA